jgi:hypothetical protein
MSDYPYFSHGLYISFAESLENGKEDEGVRFGSRNPKDVTKVC